MHRREMQLAHISLVIVLVFVLSHSVKWIPNIWEFRKAQLGQVTSYYLIYNRYKITVI